MQRAKTITIIANKEEVQIKIDAVLYVQMQGNYAFIHVSKDLVYQTRMTFAELEEVLGESFIRLNRGCMVSAKAIYNITDKVNLCNGESLEYVVRRKKEIVDNVHKQQEAMLNSFKTGEIPQTDEEYHEHYRVFDHLPIAFTDIEMVFDRECHAIDWIFRYGNESLAELEQIPLGKLIGSSFGSIFPNMDAKWLQNYERAALYGETLKIIDYSPEIDTYLEVVCFPTFPGHCGCILFDISKLNFFRSSSDTEKALVIFLEKILSGK